MKNRPALRSGGGLACGGLLDSLNLKAFMRARPALHLVDGGVANMDEHLIVVRRA